MATSAILQTLVAGHVPRRSSMYLKHQQKAALMQVRCQVENSSPEEPIPPKAAGATPPPPMSQPPKAPKPTPKVSTKFSDILAFSGPAPERINGRLAMVGFVAALGVELAKGDDVMAQLMNGGVPWFVGTSILLSIASLVPLFKGVRVEAQKGRLMTPDAEMWNGRFAMLGLVALVFTEYLTGGALI